MLLSPLLPPSPLYPIPNVDKRIESTAPSPPPPHPFSFFKWNATYFGKSYTLCPNSSTGSDLTVVPASRNRVPSAGKGRTPTGRRSIWLYDWEVSDISKKRTLWSCRISYVKALRSGGVKTPGLPRISIFYFFFCVCSTYERSFWVPSLWVGVNLPAQNKSEVRRPPILSCYRNIQDHYQCGKLSRSEPMQTWTLNWSCRIKCHPVRMLTLFCKSLATNPCVVRKENASVACCS